MPNNLPFLFHLQLLEILYKSNKIRNGKTFRSSLYHGTPVNQKLIHFNKNYSLRNITSLL